MNTVEFLPVAVCIDCAMWAANQDDSGASSEWLARVGEPLQGGTIRDYVSTLIIESGDDTERFSWSACHGCGDPLGGTRLDAWEPTS